MKHCPENCDSIMFPFEHSYITLLIVMKLKEKILKIILCGKILAVFLDYFSGLVSNNNKNTAITIPTNRIKWKQFPFKIHV